MLLFLELEDGHVPTFWPPMPRHVVFRSGGVTAREEGDLQNLVSTENPRDSYLGRAWWPYDNIMFMGLWYLKRISARKT